MTSSPKNESAMTEGRHPWPKVGPVRRALVTGASGGLGLGLARRLATRGLEVWLAARRMDVIRLEVDTIVRAGGRAHALRLDVEDDREAMDTLTRLDESSGGIDLVVANAGVAGAQTVGLPHEMPWAMTR